MSARRPLVIGNWKMHGDGDAARSLASEIVSAVAPHLERVDVGIAPPFTALSSVGEAIGESGVALGAQNVHPEERGAYTGEVAPPMLTALGVRHVLVGHSERRSLFGETDEGARGKVASCARHGLTPVLCIGETEDERDVGATLAVVERQVRIGLADLPERDGGSIAIVVAYEPVWAIGTGRTPSAGEVQEVHGAIRGYLGGMLGAEAASVIRILYGGSVSPANAAELLGLPDVDGGLVGGASLSADKFTPIVAAAGSRR